MGDNVRSVGSTIVPFEGMGEGLLSLNETVRDLRLMTTKVGLALL